MKTYIDAQGQRQPDRRVHRQVRVVFEKAWVLMKPLLEAEAGKAEVSGFSLALQLRNAFPELSRAELHLLVSTAMRMQSERRGLVAARMTDS